MDEDVDPNYNWSIPADVQPVERDQNTDYSRVTWTIDGNTVTTPEQAESLQ